MISPSGAVKVMIATKPVDFRKGAEGLAALVKAEMGADPFSGTIYVFRAKRTDRIKLIFWDGSGVCLVAKRLEDDREYNAGLVRTLEAEVQRLKSSLTPEGECASCVAWHEETTRLQAEARDLRDKNEFDASVYGKLVDRLQTEARKCGRHGL